MSGRNELVLAILIFLAAAFCISYFDIKLPGLGAALRQSERAINNAKRRMERSDSLPGGISGKTRDHPQKPLNAR